MKISAVSMPFIVPQFPVKRLAGKFLKKVENSFPVWDFLGVGWAVKSFGQESR